MNWHPTAPPDQTRPDPADVFAAGLALHYLANTAYPIAHLTTMRPYRVPNAQAQSLAPQAWQDVERLGLYVHVPFCKRRCTYCEYCVIDPARNAQEQDAYFDLLLDEFELWRQAADTQAKTLVGFDIGGGTPALPPPAQIARVIEAAHRCFRLPEEVTISIETTPKIAALEPAKLHAYRAMGIGRISMGVQTVSPRLLDEMGRTATTLAWNQAAAENIRAAGFGKFNVDIMYGFARQPLQSVQATLRHAIALSPDYITLYRMRYKGTRIAGQATQVSREEAHAQYALARQMLLAAGYAGTPGKNTFSRLPGDAGTSDYLTERVIHGTPYLGLGLGAQSLSEVTLAYNAGAADKRLEHYRRMVESGRLPIQDLYHLSPEAAAAKMISVAFYFGEIHLPSFQHKFGRSLEQMFAAQVQFVLESGYMAYAAPDVLRLTAAGEPLYNGVIALFYAGAVQQHLLSIAPTPTPPPVGDGILPKVGIGKWQATYQYQLSESQEVNYEHPF